MTVKEGDSVFILGRNRKIVCEPMIVYNGKKLTLKYAKTLDKHDAIERKAARKAEKVNNKKSKELKERNKAASNVLKKQPLKKGVADLQKYKPRDIVKYDGLKAMASKLFHKNGYKITDFAISVVRQLDQSRSRYIVVVTFIYKDLKKIVNDDVVANAINITYNADLSIKKATRIMKVHRRSDSEANSYVMSYCEKHYPDSKAIFNNIYYTRNHKSEAALKKAMNKIRW